MKSKKINIDIYGEQCFFFWGKNPDKYFKNRFKDYEGIIGAQGCFFCLEDKRDGEMKGVIWVQDKSKVDLIVHEISHLVTHICEYKRIICSEAEAYFFQYIFKQVTEL